MSVILVLSIFQVGFLNSQNLISNDMPNWSNTGLVFISISTLVTYFMLILSI